MDSCTTDELREKRIKKYIDRMPSLSTTVMKVTEVCNNPNTSPNDLNRVISLDPVLTAKVLKLVNSAFYSLPNQITSLTRAIIMLGMNTVKNLALSTAVLETMHTKSSATSSNLDTEAFWLHSLSVGVISKLLAEINEIPFMQRDQYFVAGLLHDLGKVPLNNYFAKDYSAVVSLVKEEEIPLVAAEKRIMKTDHTMVGKMIAEKWKLDETMTSVLAYHHRIWEGKEEHMDILRIVGIANMYSYILNIGSAGDDYPDTSDMQDMIAKAGFSEESFSRLNDIVQKEIEKASIFLEIAS